MDRGWTQARLASEAGVSRQWVVAVEGGCQRGAEIGKILLLLDALDASLLVRADGSHGGQPLRAQGEDRVR